ncbi:MAG: XdhC family protein [Planctomycetes bacterium]|nr:XdhC family protein [Planctomycetota bacterium]
MTDLLTELEKLRIQGGRAALGTIVATAGSTPGKEAMKLLVKSDGSFLGTVGGGCLEAEVYETAMDVLRGSPPKLLKFQLNERDYPDSGLLCGGVVTVFVEAVDEPAAIFTEMKRLRDAGVPLVRVSAIGQVPAGVGRSRVIARDGTDLGALRHSAIDTILIGAANETLRRDRPSRVTLTIPGAAPFDVFIEPVTLPLILLFGGGHVSGAITTIARLADFRIIVIDDREGFANRERHPEAAETVVSTWEDAVARFAPARNARCVVVTRGHKDDERVLLEMAGRDYDPVYLGMIGSRTKQKIVLANLRAAGVSESFINKIRTPIGLDIGARSHAEIAVSVVAELIQLRRKGA